MEGGIFENMMDEIQSLKRLVLDLYQNSGDGIGRVMEIKEAAEYLGMTENGLYQRVRSGTIPYIKNRYGKVVFSEKYLKLAQLAPDQQTIDDLSIEMNREFSKRK